MVQILTCVLVRCHKVLSLLLDNFGDFIDVFCLSVRTLAASFPQSLLTETDHFGFCVELVSDHLPFISGCVGSKLFAPVLREEVFSRDFLDGFTMLGQIVDFLGLQLVLVLVLLELGAKASYRLLVLRLLFLVQEGVGLLHV